MAINHRRDRPAKYFNHKESLNGTNDLPLRGIKILGGSLTRCDGWAAAPAPGIERGAYKLQHFDRFPYPCQIEKRPSACRGTSSSGFRVHAEYLILRNRTSRIHSQKV